MVHHRDSMQQNTRRLRKPVPSFDNHTPRRSNTHSQPRALHSESNMFGPTGLAVGTGLLPLNTHKDSTPSTMLSEDTAFHRRMMASRRFERSRQDEDTSSSLLQAPDHPSQHYYLTDENARQPSVSVKAKSNAREERYDLPRDNAFHDLVDFLRTTGPMPQRTDPARPEQFDRASSVSKSGLRLFRRGGKRQASLDLASGKRSSHDSVDREARHLQSSSVKLRGAEQKVSLNGKRYMALQVPTSIDEDLLRHGVPTFDDTELLEPRTSALFAEAINWFPKSRGSQWSASEMDKETISTSISSKRGTRSERIAARAPTPARPLVSAPLSLSRESKSLPITSTYGSSQQESEIVSTRESAVPRTLPHRIEVNLPRVFLSEDFSPTENFLTDNEEDEIKQPAPQRMGSHPVLLKRASTVAASYQPQRTSDCPDPPLRSPLRLRRDPRVTEDIIAKHVKTAPKIAPDIRAVSEPLVRGTVITECTGPISRSTTRSKDKHGSISHPAYPASRKQREERTRARKLRDRPQVTHAVGSSEHERSAEPSRMQRTHPRLQIPEIRPMLTHKSPTAMSAGRPGSALSDGTSFDWHNIMNMTTPDIDPAPSSDAVNPQTSNPFPKRANGESAGEMSSARPRHNPDMLLAEELPLPRTKSTPKPNKITVKNAFAPRPRSATMSQLNDRRHRSSIHATPRASTPTLHHYDGENELTALPSPPPNRALPPTPPASGSEKSGKHRKKWSSSSKPANISPVEESSAAEANYSQPTVLFEDDNYNISKDDNVPTVRGPQTSTMPLTHDMLDIRTQLEAERRRNQLLEAALQAMLRTNGAVDCNGLSNLLGIGSQSNISNNQKEKRLETGPDATSVVRTESQVGNSPGEVMRTLAPAPTLTTSWEMRIARRSAADQSTGSSLSGGSGGGRSGHGSSSELLAIGGRSDR